MPMVHAAVKMLHEVDPKQQLIEESKELVQYCEPMGSLVLVAVYVRGEVGGKEQKTAGGILLPHGARDEDKFQGKVGVILKCGPLAFVEDETHKWGASKPEINDWVVFRVGDTFPFVIDKKTFRFVEDIDIRAVWTGSPDLLI